jgi:hypothetical protein
MGLAQIAVAVVTAWLVYAIGRGLRRADGTPRSRL